VLEQLQKQLRELSHHAERYGPVLKLQSNGIPIAMAGHSHAHLSHAVYKSDGASGYLAKQATFMRHLGEKICPKVIAVNDSGYCMEYLHPVIYHPFLGCIVEEILDRHVWGRRPPPYIPWKDELITSIKISREVLEEFSQGQDYCLIHGDATFDNALIAKDGSYRMTDPIPPLYLTRPSIKAIDHGRILQSILGWEVVLRGSPLITYEWPKFMQEEKSARAAIFWCFVVLRRIALKDNSDAGKWAMSISEELRCML
jgi:hypothetical protein